MTRDEVIAWLYIAVVVSHFLLGYSYLSNTDDDGHLI